jgi:AcrR family transcriptional regulator
MTSDNSRDRMIRSAAVLIARRGATATSFNDVIDHSGAPRGSIYHHFPKGKDEMTAAAMQLVAGHVAARQRAAEPKTAVEVLSSFIGMWREVVVRSGGASGCAIAGTAVDAESQDLIAVAKAAFHQWSDLLAGQFAATDIEAERAAGLATITIAALEGALILCRTERSPAPLDAVAAQLERLLPPQQRRPKRKRPGTRPGP